MVRSPGFGSIATDLFALLRLGFPAAPGDYPLTLPVTITRRLILQQARGQALNGPPTARRHTDSCSISLPSRGSFHLSLAVLVRYRSPAVLSLVRWSSRIQPGLHVARLTREFSQRHAPFAYGAITRSGRASQRVRLSAYFVTLLPVCHPAWSSHDPPYATPAGYHA